MDLEEIYNKILSAENYRVLILPFVLMAFDFITGISHAWATGHLKSYKMREGLNKKVGEITMIVVGLLFNWTIGVPKYVTYGLVFYVVVMELISIAENLDKMGVPIPKAFQKALRNAEYKIQNEDPNKKEGDSE